MRRLKVGLAMLALAIVIASGAHARRLIIITIDFEPDGFVNRPGTIVSLIPVLDDEWGPQSDKVVYELAVVQADTGAWAFETITLPAYRFGGSDPNPAIRVSPDIGSPRFEPGSVLVHTEATRLSKDGQVVRSWSWISAVELLEQ
jgi:hypothetical protein